MVKFDALFFILQKVTWISKAWSSQAQYGFVTLSRIKFLSIQDNP